MGIPQYDRAIYFTQVMPDVAGTFFARLHPRDFSRHPFHDKRPLGKQNQTTNAGVYGEFCESAEVWNRGVVPEQGGEAAYETGMGEVGLGAKWFLEICLVDFGSAIRLVDDRKGDSTSHVYFLKIARV